MYPSADLNGFPGLQRVFPVPPWLSWGFGDGEGALEVLCVDRHRLSVLNLGLFCVFLMVFQHAEETGAAGPGGGPAVSIPLPCTDCARPPDPPGDEGPGPARTPGRGTAEDAAGGRQEPRLGEVSLGVARAGQHPDLSLLAPADRPPPQQHALPHMQDDRAHLLPGTAQLQHLHPVSQQSLQPVRLQPQPTPHPGNAVSSSGDLPGQFGWVVGWPQPGFAGRGSCLHVQKLRLGFWQR